MADKIVALVLLQNSFPVNRSPENRIASLSLRNSWCYMQSLSNAYTPFILGLHCLTKVMASAWLNGS
jgi:hypothetical protein